MKDDISKTVQLIFLRFGIFQLNFKRCFCDKELIENVSEMSHIIFDCTAAILEADILNAEGKLTQPLDPMNITDSKVKVPGS